MKTYLGEIDIKYRETKKKINVILSIYIYSFG